MTHLIERDIPNNPLELFERWYEDIHQSGSLNEPAAVILATCGRDLQPSVRTILLKDHSEQGFTFYTNYNSKKGQDLKENPHAALLFFWDQLARQIRIKGKVEQVSAQDSDTYFASRPKGSKLGAIASPQSEVIEKNLLDAQFKQVEQQFENEDAVPRPSHWGGYSLKPTYFEFWQGQLNRMHDRIVYEKTGNDSWEIYRLAP